MQEEVLERKYSLNSSHFFSISRISSEIKTAQCSVHPLLQHVQTSSSGSTFLQVLDVSLLHTPHSHQFISCSAYHDDYDDSLFLHRHTNGAKAVFFNQRSADPPVDRSGIAMGL